jgi:DNA polymerase III epsilon subunit-like protein
MRIDMDNVMVDLETLGTLPGYVILSIGAVAFDEFTVAEDGFYVPIRRIDCELHGLKTSASTLAWWEKQSPEARKVLNDPTGITLPDALSSFNNYLQQFPDTVSIWGNGANFDNPLLACAYAAVGIKPYYAFWNERCYRTVKNQYPDVELERKGTYHNALDDARCQAEHLVLICQRRGWNLK